MTTKKLTKLLALYLPYILLGLVATNFGEAWRLAEGKELGDKIMSMMGTIPVAFANPLPSLYPLDLLVGLCCGAGLRLAVYLRGKNAKKYRHGMEYGSARWGTPKDIEPFMAPKFADNIILTKTERLMMSNRPPDPKNARNKNVLVVGGSGSGKTRFWLKPNLLQCHSSYVVTDPKGSIVVECGNALLKNGYKVRILNTILNAELKEGQTTPPKHFTEDLLLHAMETASADSMPEGVERQGIGTPATRAATIEKLVQKGFLERKGTKKTKVLLPTDKGKALITVMPEEIQSADMTADWEAKLLQIERSEMEPETFMTEIKEMISSLVTTTEAAKGANALMKNKIVGVCPNCGANVVEREKGWFCENRECRFALWKDNAYFKRLGKHLDGRMVDKLLRDGRVRLKDCRSAKGKTYNATVLLSCEADGRSKFSLEFEGGC